MSETPAKKTKNAQGYAYWFPYDTVALRIAVLLALGKDPEKIKSIGFEEAEEELKKSPEWHLAVNRYLHKTPKDVDPPEGMVRLLEFIEWAMRIRAQYKERFPNFPKELENFLEESKEYKRLHGEVAEKSRDKYLLVIDAALASGESIDIHSPNAVSAVVTKVARRAKGTVSTRFVRNFITDLRKQKDSKKK